MKNISTSNKSRAEQSFVFVDDDYKNQLNTIPKKRGQSNGKLNDNISRKSACKSKKKSSPTTNQKKYFPGEFIYDTKGQMAEIKYIGQCHKGPGTWFGIEFIDGTLGKHNGTINGHTYFRGEYRRCDMIRGHKIRSKASPPDKLKNKYKSSNKTNGHNLHRLHSRRRANSDILKMKSMSLADLSCNFSDNYFKKKKFNDACNNKLKYKRKKRKKHTRNASQPAAPLLMNDQERSYSAFGIGNNNKSREDRSISSRQYQKKVKQIRTVKKEKYKGNKYILAMEQETEKRKNMRIGLIKTEKQRVKKQKHERNSSKVQEILKQKHLEKQQLLKLNEENKLKELERIQLAKQKSKTRIRVNRIRSNSENGKNNNNKRKNIIFHTPDINKINRNRNAPNVPYIVIDDQPLIPLSNDNNASKDSQTPTNTTNTTNFDDDISLRISDTSLTDKNVEFNLTPKLPKINKNKNNNNNNNNNYNNNNNKPLIDNIAYDTDSLDDNDESFDEIEESPPPDTPELLKAYSDSDVHHHNESLLFPTNTKMHKMDAMFPVNSDTVVILQELSTIDSDECPSPFNSILPVSITPTKQKKNIVNIPPLLKENDDIKDIEEEEEMDTTFHFPILFGDRKARSIPGDIEPLKRTNSTPLFNTFDDKGTDYWIKKYNKMNQTLNDTQNEIQKQIDGIKQNDDNISKPEPIPISISKSTPITTPEQKDDNEEENDSFYFPMSSGQSLRQRSQSLSIKPSLKRIDSAPIIVNDDKGTDYWIKQYNKANKKKSKTKLKSKRKSKSKQKKLSRTKTVAKNDKSVNKSDNNNNRENNNNNKPSPYSSYFQADLDEINCDISDILTPTSTLSTLSTLSTISLDSMTINSTISSIISSPSTSAESTPNDNNNDATNSNIINFNKAISNASYQSKYGVYPFKRKHEQYINKKFTGIVRIGHRYLLRDGRIGIVRYVNQARFAPGTWIGFELDKSDGEHNGIVNNVKYFTCQSMHGTFVKKSQIAQYIGRDNTKSLSKNQLKRLNNNSLVKLSL